MFPNVAKSIIEQHASTIEQHASISHINLYILGLLLLSILFCMLLGYFFPYLLSLLLIYYYGVLFGMLLFMLFNFVNALPMDIPGADPKDWFKDGNFDLTSYFNSLVLALYNNLWDPVSNLAQVITLLITGFAGVMLSLFVSAFCPAQGAVGAIYCAYASFWGNVYTGLFVAGYAIWLGKMKHWVIAFITMGINVPIIIYVINNWCTNSGTLLNSFKGVYDSFALIGSRVWKLGVWIKNLFGMLWLLLKLRITKPWKKWWNDDNDKKL